MCYYDEDCWDPDNDGQPGLDYPTYDEHQGDNPWAIEHEPPTEDDDDDELPF